MSWVFVCFFWFCVVVVVFVVCLVFFKRENWVISVPRKREGVICAEQGSAPLALAQLGWGGWTR